MKLTKKYHIYIRGYCYYPNLEEEEFKEVWESIHQMSSIYSDVKPEELSYEEVIYNKKDYLLEGN